MDFSKTTGRAMDLTSARKWTAAYQESEKQRTGNPTPVKAHAFGADKINELMQGASGIRIYPGHDDNGEPHMILVAVDDQGNDLTAKAIVDPASATSDVLQYSSQCPPICSNSISGL